MYMWPLHATVMENKELMQHMEGSVNIDIFLSNFQNVDAIAAKIKMGYVGRVHATNIVFGTQKGYSMIGNPSMIFSTSNFLINW